jgi:hypothetical protein
MMDENKLTDIAIVQRIGPRVCRALGLDPKRVRKLTIVCEARDLVRVSVEMAATVEGLDAISTILAEYKLVPIDDIVDVTSIGDKFVRHEKQPPVRSNG